VPLVPEDAKTDVAKKVVVNYYRLKRIAIALRSMRTSGRIEHTGHKEPSVSFLASPMPKSVDTEHHGEHVTEFS
jgi:hypothetical protein